MLVEQIYCNLKMFFFLKIIYNLLRTLGDFLIRVKTSHRRNKEAEFGFLWIFFLLLVTCFVLNVFQDIFPSTL